MLRAPNLGIALFAAAAVLALAPPAQAQVMGPSMPAAASPAVSPYLNMIDNGFNFSGVSNYNTLVRPLLDQSEATTQQGQAIRQLQQQLNSNPGTAYRARGSTTLRSTGHNTRFMNYSHFYTPARPAVVNIPGGRQ